MQRRAGLGAMKIAVLSSQISATRQSDGETWIAGKRAALEHMAHMIGEAGIDSAPNHVSADYGNLGVPDIELGENFLREIHHPVEIAVAAGHAAAAEDDRTADLLPASTMWEKSAFTASRSKYSVPVPR